MSKSENRGAVISCHDINYIVDQRTACCGGKKKKNILNNVK